MINIYYIVLTRDIGIIIQIFHIFFNQSNESNNCICYYRVKNDKDRGILITTKMTFEMANFLFRELMKTVIFIYFAIYNLFIYGFYSFIFILYISIYNIISFK